MLVFIDDSGDPGFKIGKGSSLVFVIACIIFDDELQAEKTALAIKELRRELKFPDSIEFKFSKSSKEVRVKFCCSVSDYKFKIRCLVINKGVNSEAKSYAVIKIHFIVTLSNYYLNIMMVQFLMPK